MATPTVPPDDHRSDGGQREPDLSRPVFVLTCARSGSTLLRLILDTHPDLGCPPETRAAYVCTHLTSLWSVLQGIPHRDRHSGVQVRTVHATAAIRRAIEEPVSEFLRRVGKVRWCDKSLDNAGCAEMLANIWPQASFVCLTRHCMDVVASGVEACRFGLAGYGYDAYTARYPGNSVAAIAECWLDSTEAMLRFQRQYPQRCIRVRYEDLAATPEPVVAGLLDFIGAAPAPGITSDCFKVRHVSGGPADAKVWFTNSVHDGSVGRGASVPSHQIPGPVRKRVNAVLAELGYGQVTGDWGRGLSEEDAAASGTSYIPAVTGARLAEAAERWPHLRGRVVGAVFRISGAGAERASWRIGGPAGGAAGEPDAEVAVVGDLPVWQSVLSGETNFAAACVTGDLRVVGQDLPVVRVPDEAHAVAFLLGLGAVPGTVSPLAMAAARALRSRAAAG